MTTPTQKKLGQEKVGQEKLGQENFEHEKLGHASVAYDCPIIIVGGGDIDTLTLKNIAQHHPVIAVDGGANHLAQTGLEPELLIGDLDSAHPSRCADIAKQIHITDQYSTDFQKALHVLDAPKIFGFGFLGQRLDHSLATLHALSENPKKNIILIDPFDIVVMAQGQFIAPLPQGIRLSIWSMTPQRFDHSKGLVWPVDGLEIGAGQSLATSNQVIIPHGDMSHDVQVEIISEDQHPFAVIMAPEALTCLLNHDK